MNSFQQIVSQVAALGLKTLTDSNPALSAVTFAPDTMGQQIVYGSAVKIRVPVRKTSAVFDPAVGIVDQDTEYERFSVTIDKAIQCSFNINLGEASSETRLQEIVTDAAGILAESVGRKVVEDILLAASDATYFPLQKVVAIGNGDYDTAVSLEERLDDQLLFSNRNLVVNSALYGEFLGDERVITSNKNSGATTIRTGVLTDIAGFVVSKSTSLKNILSGFRGFATDGSGIAFVPMIPVDLQQAFNLPKVADTYIYTDPNTNISIYFQGWFDPKLVKTRVVAILFYGIGKCRRNGITRIVATGSDVTTIDES
jgi:hypothetical protein